MEANFRWLQTKVEELEYRLNKKTKTNNSGSDASKTERVKVLETVTSTEVSEQTNIKVGTISVKKGNGETISGSVTIWANAESEVNLAVTVDGYEITNETISLKRGRNVVPVLGQINCYKTGDVDVFVRLVKSPAVTASVMLTGVKLTAMGYEVNDNANLSVSADSAGGFCAICVSDGENAYYYESRESVTSLTTNDFEYLGAYKKAAVIVNIESGSAYSVKFLLTPSGELKVIFGESEPKVIASGVTDFSAAAYQSRDRGLVAFIKDGQPYYAEILGKVAATPVKISVAENISVNGVVAVGSCADITYLLLITSGGVNYLYYAFADKTFSSATDKVYLTNLSCAHSW